MRLEQLHSVSIDVSTPSANFASIEYKKNHYYKNFK